MALTNDDENNMMACVLAEKSGQRKRTIAIVTKSNYNLLQDSLNIDDLVDPRMTTVSRIWSMYIREPLVQFIQY